MKLIDADELRESLEFNLKVYQKLADKQTPVNAKFVVADLKHFMHVIDEAPDIALTWEGIRTIVKIADELAEYAEAGIIEPFLANEEAYYREILKRFNAMKVK